MADMEKELLKRTVNSIEFFLNPKIPGNVELEREIRERVTRNISITTITISTMTNFSRPPCFGAARFSGVMRPGVSFGGSPKGTVPAKPFSPPACIYLAITRFRTMIFWAIGMNIGKSRLFGTSPKTGNQLGEGNFSGAERVDTFHRTLTRCFYFGFSRTTCILSPRYRLTHRVSGWPSAAGGLAKWDRSTMRILLTTRGMKTNNW